MGRFETLIAESVAVDLGDAPDDLQPKLVAAAAVAALMAMSGEDDEDSTPRRRRGLAQHEDDLARLRRGVRVPARARRSPPCRQVRGTAPPAEHGGLPDVRRAAAAQYALRPRNSHSLETLPMITSARSRPRPRPPSAPSSAATCTLPGDAGYDDARAAWNLAVDQRPPLVAEPRTADDVAALVRFARRQRPARRAAGHGPQRLGPRRRRRVDPAQHAQHARRRDRQRPTSPPASRPARCAPT